jgi:membrane-associated phospholipid phosphatase
LPVTYGGCAGPSRVRAVWLTGLVLLALPVTVARADATASAGELTGPLPLSAGFSPLERVTAVTATAGGLFLLIAGDTMFDPPAPSMGPPAADSLDARISRALYRPGKGRFLARVPDYGGNLVLPVLPLVFYGLDTYFVFAQGRPRLVTDDFNPHYRLMAYVEVMGWTYLVTGAVKYLVGRPRPYTAQALDRPELTFKPREDNLSFFSGHASSTFAVGAFVTEDVSRALRRGPLAGASPLRRFLLGGLLPAVVGYGIPTLVSLSRVIDQQHWTTDVVAGAAVGALIANLTYAAHFDDAGRALLRHEALRGVQVSLVPALSNLSGPLVGAPSRGLSLVGGF